MFKKKIYKEFVCDMLEQNAQKLMVAFIYEDNVKIMQKSKEKTSSCANNGEQESNY